MLHTHSPPLHTHTHTPTWNHLQMRTIGNLLQRTRILAGSHHTMDVKWLGAIQWKMSPCTANRGHTLNFYIISILHLVAKQDHQCLGVRPRWVFNKLSSVGSVYPCTLIHYTSTLKTDSHITIAHPYIYTEKWN